MAIDVVAGIVFDADGERVLLARRHAGQHQGNCWEFPGGKIEPGEAVGEALVRELGEELGIQPRRWKHRTTLEHAYPEQQVRLHFVDVTEFDGEPVGREGQAVSWTALAELGELEFPEANRGVVEELIGGGAGRLDRLDE